jgi:hypothetical protein
MKKALYVNKKFVDWNFDYARNCRMEIRGVEVELPCEIADQYPQYFTRIKPEPKVEVKEVKPIKDEVVVTEVESEKVEELVKDEVLEININIEPEIDDVPVTESFSKSFENAIKNGEVKETRKYYTWNNKKIMKDAFEAAENKDEFLAEVLCSK